MSHHLSHCPPPHGQQVLAHKVLHFYRNISIGKFAFIHFLTVDHLLIHTKRAQSTTLNSQDLILV